ncbi:uncharacterized protein LOC131595951 [Vicia villosa]|uniref:uncharacterized protein LOC131595951 n=1 Tax=Vicia villosa TaxID=3911 RepID=UPI00273BB303|nr:uncharacterized protein LOC131595951 [Vicia villosa]
MVKRKRVSQILAKAKVDLIFIQETKLKKMEESLIRSLWGWEDCEWSALDSEGQSGGVVTIWRKGVIKPEFSFKAKCVLGVNAVWKGGDFNAIKVEEERCGRVQANRVEMEEFANFIELMEVVDLPVLGNKFTWINSSGKAKSRLDRFLLSEGINNLWKIVAQVTGNRDISDHRPIWVKACNRDWGPKPFKVFNCWHEHPEFENFVKEEWNSKQVKGSSAFVLKGKIKNLRERLRWWNQKVFGWLDLKIEDEVDDLNGLEEENMLITSQLNQEVSEKRKQLQSSIWKDLHLKESILKQKARVRWIRKEIIILSIFIQ